MFAFRKRRPDPVGTALLCATPQERDEMIVAGGVMRDGADVSWMNGMRVGDDQGQTSACQLFDMGKWREIMTGTYIADTTVLHLYHETLSRLRRKDGVGLTTKEAFAAAQSAGWFGGDEKLSPATLDDLTAQPLISIYDNDVFTGTNRAGCVNVNAWLRNKAYHSVCMVAKGHIKGSDQPWVYHAGSWGLRYGYKGITMMPAWRHREACRELWKVVKR